MASAICGGILRIRRLNAAAYPSRSLRRQAATFTTADRTFFQGLGLLVAGDGRTPPDGRFGCLGSPTNPVLGEPARGISTSSRRIWSSSSVQLAAVSLIGLRRLGAGLARTRLCQSRGGGESDSQVNGPFLIDALDCGVAFDLPVLLPENPDSASVDAVDPAPGTGS